MMDINPSQTSDKPLSLSDFAQHNQITEDRVWELIEEGELAARFVNDEILILREHEIANEPRVDFVEAPDIAIQVAEVELPAPIPAIPEFVPPAPKPSPAAAVTPSFTASHDEIETATEEDMEPFPSDDHRELLMFAQDAMNRTMDLSRQLLSTKDELIRMKEEKIQYLVAELQNKALEIRRLKSKVEDLETLCRLTPDL